MSVQMIAHNDACVALQQAIDHAEQQVASETEYCDSLKESLKRSASTIDSLRRRIAAYKGAIEALQ
jgi:septal ring factor EnvC (AmiA/AmiB activator)